MAANAVLAPNETITREEYNELLKVRGYGLTLDLLGSEGVQSRGDKHICHRENACLYRRWDADLQYSLEDRAVDLQLSELEPYRAIRAHKLDDYRRRRGVL